MRTRTTRLFVASALAAGFLAADIAAFAPRADAAHHLVRIRQVFPGSTTTATNAEFVVLQLTAANENFLAPAATVRLYDELAQQNSGDFATMPPNGENQRTVLVATAQAETTFGVQADLELTDDEALNHMDGAACLTSTSFPGIDCVEWGDGTNAVLMSNTGTLEPAFADGSMLVRSIASGCPTLHEFGDDTDDSAADFAPVAVPMGFMPRNNAAPITETTCAPPATTPPGNPTSPINPAGNVRKRKCKKKKGGAAAKKKCKRKKK